MTKITEIKLGHRKWTEDERNFFEPVLRVKHDDDTKVDYIFCDAKFGQLLPLEEGLVVMITRDFVWSSVRKSTIVERYVIQAQVAGLEPQIFQSFRLFEIKKGEKAKPSRWMWNNGPLEEPFASEKKADEPNSSIRKWLRGPETNCVVLKDPDRPRQVPKPGRGKPGGFGRPGGRPGFDKKGFDNKGSDRKGGSGKPGAGRFGNGRSSSERGPATGSSSEPAVVVKKKRRRSDVF